jgi:hypothetical protein
MKKINKFLLKIVVATMVVILLIILTPPHNLIDYLCVFVCGGLIGALWAFYYVGLKLGDDF